MSKGSNSTTQNTNSSSSTMPSPEAFHAYQDLLTRATGVSQTPYAGYQGQEVAGLTDAQKSAEGQAGDWASGFAGLNPAGMINDAGEWVTGSDIANYTDPWTSQVIDATTRDFDTQNKRSLSNVAGNAGSIGALGGNSVGVAKALTTEANQRVQDPIIASLRAQGFTNAEAMANAQKLRELQAGQSLGQQQGQALGVEATLGATEQQTQQAQFTQQMTDYYQQQGYPFATAQWLAAITTGVGSQMGSKTTGTGTQTTQGPQPNQFVQGAGLGIAGLGALGTAGGSAGIAGLAPLLAFSDRRLKEGIQEIGRLHDGQKIYRFRYKGDPTTHVGMLSQEVEKSHPGAVSKVGGFGAVDYDKATEDAIKKWSGGTVRGFEDGGAPDLLSSMPTDIGPSNGISRRGVPYTYFQGDTTPVPLNRMGPTGVWGSESEPTTRPSWLFDVHDPRYESDPRYAMSIRAPGTRASGGAVAGFAGGGTPYGPSTTGWVPGMQMPSAQPLHGPELPRFSDPKMGDPNKAAMDQIGKVGKINFGNFGSSIPQYNWDANPVGGLDLVGPDSTGGAYHSGGSVPVSMGFGGGIEMERRGYLSGGVPLPFESGDIDATDAGPVNIGGKWDRDAVDTSNDLAGNDVVGPGDHPVKTISYTKSGFAPEENPPDESPQPARYAQVKSPRGVAGAPEVASDAMPGGSATPVEPQKSGFGFRMSDEARQGLIAMGLAMMGNRTGGKGSFLAGVGDAGVTGMGTYASARNATIAQQTLQRKEAFERQKQQELENHRRALEQHQQGMLDRSNFRPTGTTLEDGITPVFYDTRNGQMFANGKPLTGNEKLLNPKNKPATDPFATPPDTSTPPAEPTKPAPTPAPAPPAPAKPQENTPQASDEKPKQASFVPTTDPTKPMSNDYQRKLTENVATEQEEKIKRVENTHQPGTHPEVLDNIRKNMPGLTGLPETIKAVAEGRIKLSTMPSRQIEYEGKKYNLKDLITRGVNLYKDDFEESNAKNRADTMNDLKPSGKTGQLVLGVNQVLEHINHGSDLAEQMHNGNSKFWNTANLWWASNVKGDPIVKRFETVRDVMALDAARIMRGNGSFTEKEVKEWQDHIQAAGSPRQLQGVLRDLSGSLLGSRMSSIEHTYRMMVGKNAPDLLSDRAKASLKAIDERADKAEQDEIERRAGSQPKPSGVPEGSTHGKRGGKSGWLTPTGQFIAD